MAKRKKKSDPLLINDGAYTTAVFLRRIGKLKDASIVPGRLTIFSGPNGSGKTTALYSLYGVLSARIAKFRTQYTDDLARALTENGSVTVDPRTLSDDLWEKLSDAAAAFFSESLPDVLNCDLSLLPDAKISFRVNRQNAFASWGDEWNFRNVVMAGESLLMSSEMDGDRPLLTFRIGDRSRPIGSLSQYIANVLFDVTAFPFQNRCYLLPSERAGINLFYQELNSRRTALISNLQKKDIDPMQLMRDVMLSRYARPIADYIDLLNEFVGAKRVEGEYAHLADQLDQIALGSFELSKDGSIFFRPKGAKKNKLSLHLAASSAKSLYGLSHLLRYRLEEHDVVMIDEPELNLHPDAQRSFAQFVGRMVSSGLSVMLSTHSDYIVREINTLMLSKDSGNRIDPEDVELYLFDAGGDASRIAKDEHGNFAIDPFESSIRALNDAFVSVMFD